MTTYKGLPVIDRGGFLIVQCEQGSADWWQARAGIPTASEFGRIITPKQMKPSAAQDGYIDELIADRVSLNPNYFTEKGRPVTAAMTNGIDLEPEARRYYEMHRDAEVERVGFCLSLCGRFGASPDGLVNDGGLELKCPELKTQIGYLRAGTLPDDYRAQVHGSMIVTGASWWDFMSYNPSVDPLLIRVERDEFTEKLEKCLLDFCDKFAEAARSLIRA